MLLAQQMFTKMEAMQFYHRTPPYPQIQHKGTDALNMKEELPQKGGYRLI
jgi:hypothetical protein